MRRRFLTPICSVLLLWATLDDVLAAQTPEPDDDLAVALDNDCVQCAPVKVPSRTEAPMSFAADIDFPLELAATIPRPVERSLPLANRLYLFMSLQR